MSNRIAVLFSVALLLGSAWAVHAQPPVPAASPTVISVPDMHCPSCAKKLTNELLKVPGVGQVSASVESKTMTIRPQNGTAPSPRLIWEAVEKSGYRPSRMDGPGGTFTTKPQS